MAKNERRDVHLLEQIEEEFPNRLYHEKGGHRLRGIYWRVIGNFGSQYHQRHVPALQYTQPLPKEEGLRARMSMRRTPYSGRR